MQGLALTVPQKKLLLVSLVTFAWFFAIMFCSWGEIGRHSAFVCLWNMREPTGRVIGRHGTCFSVGPGEFSELVAIGFGLLTPFALLILALYLWLGWFHHPKEERNSQSPGERNP